MVHQLRNRLPANLIHANLGGVPPPLTWRVRYGKKGPEAQMGHLGHGDCSDLLDRIHGHLEGELDPQSARELVSHLDACAPCRAYLESAAATRGALERLRLLEVWGEEDREALRRCLDRVRLKLRP